MPTYKSSSGGGFCPLTLRVFDRFCIKWMLHWGQNHPSPEKIQHSSSTHLWASSLLSQYGPFIWQSGATLVWHLTEYLLFTWANNAGSFYHWLWINTPTTLNVLPLFKLALAFSFLSNLDNRELFPFPKEKRRGRHHWKRLGEFHLPLEYNSRSFSGSRDRVKSDLRSC